MKDLFDELRDQLPADRGMKASKWEILSKAVDYIAQLKLAFNEMSPEIDRLRAELRDLRGETDSDRGPPPPHHSILHHNSDLAYPHLSLGGQRGPPGSQSPGTTPPPHLPPILMNGNGVGGGPPAVYSDRRPSVVGAGDERSPHLMAHRGMAPDSHRSRSDSRSVSPYTSHHHTPTPQQPSPPLPKLMEA